MEKKNFMYKGVKIAFNTSKMDFESTYGSSNLVHFTPEANLIIFDQTVEDEYVKWAGIHECVCCGKHQDLALSVANDDNRCGLIDLELISRMPKNYREIYRNRRVDMYKTLLEKGLNPPLNKRFQEAIKMLQK